MDNNKAFSSVAAKSSDKDISSRENAIYSRENDVRDEFERDYTRILHSHSFRRLKHKTQVFFNIGNDHICTRMEHVLHVDSVSAIIAKALGLNVNLTRAIAIAHDVGHAPFGHCGETILNKILQKKLGSEYTFWHERNGLRVVDKIDYLEDNRGKFINLSLTYGVRDGILSHCGEVDENGIKPRKEKIILEDCNYKDQQQSPYTWEGCVVKIADKISYLGRDISDALQLGFIDDNQKKKLEEIANKWGQNTIITTVVINLFISDLIENSTPDVGICFSKETFDNINELKKFNYATIYNNNKLSSYKKYCKLIIEEIFDFLWEFNKGGQDTLCFIDKTLKQGHNTEPLLKDFLGWIIQFCNPEIIPDYLKEQYKTGSYNNEKIYRELNTGIDFIYAVIDFIAGMTDRYAVNFFNSMISYS
jgi:dGTPase